MKASAIASCALGVLPRPNGRLRLVGADLLVLAADWHAKHAETPQLNGQLLHLFESPNRVGLPPLVSCDSFDG